MSFNRSGRQHIQLGIAAAALLVLSACATTQIVSKWSDPSMDPAKFGKIIVVFQDKDPGMRRALEDEAAKQIPNATASYRVLDDADIKNVEAAKAKVKSAGFATAVLMRVVSVEKEVNYVPGTMATGPGPYGHMWGSSWGYGWGTVYDPGYYRTDETLTVGTSVYSLTDDKLVYSSRSETFNPSSLTKALPEIVAANAKEVSAKK